MDNIIFIGMPAVGKSTVGVVVAKRLGYQFMDTDLLIQEEEGKLLKDIIEERINGNFDITHVFARDNRYNLDLSGIIHTQDIDEIINSDVDLVIEVMGGIDFAYETIKSLLKSGKHVVTANKDMLAIHVEELSRIANENEVQFNYEASVAGGIPVILGLQYGLNANHITRIMGILNGTTNYILTRMSQDDWEFDYALNQAQELGYAEADPTNDIGGFDARRKTAILSRLAYRREIDVEDVAVTGIEELELTDIQIAKEAGYTIKLIGLSEVQDGQIDMMVTPMLLDTATQLAKVDEAMNAVYFNGDAIGETMFYGPGAGSMETASAIVADAMYILSFGFIGNTVTEGKAPIAPQSFARKYYVRVEESTTSLENALDSNFFEVVYSGEEGTAFTTEPVTMEDAKAQLKDFNVQAIYPIAD